MNMPKVVETLQEHGITHRLVTPHVIRIAWLVDGASHVVADYDLKNNFIRKSDRFHQLGYKDRSALHAVLDNCKFKNTH